MLRRLKRSRVRVAAVGVAAMAGSFALATAAGATTSPAANNVIVASGSATLYSVDTALGDLFNGLPGCNLIALPTNPPQQLDFSCTPAATGLPRGDGENWTNDVIANEPALGSSNGINQLENQGAHTPTGVKVAAISFARSSRAPSTSDLQGLNFVAFAKDGLSYFHFTEVSGKATPSANCTDLSQATLTAIYAGTITNWDQVKNVGATTPCGANAVIAQYAAQSGSGTEATWAGFVCGGVKNCDQAYILKRGTTYANTHIILENEDHAILTNGDEANAVFYFSYGKYVVSCKTSCGGSPPPANSKVALGNINGVAPSQTTILNGTWPVPRFLYNVYSNGFNTNLVKATPATLNFMSEVGFLCKPNTFTSGGKTFPITDPITGVPVRTEIANVITSQGFFVLPFGNEGVVAHPANVAGTPYQQFDPTGQSQYQGYCLVQTTDSNSGT